MKTMTNNNRYVNTSYQVYAKRKQRKTFVSYNTLNNSISRFFSISCNHCALEGIKMCLKYSF